MYASKYAKSTYPILIEEHNKRSEGYSNVYVETLVNTRIYGNNCADNVNIAVRRHKLRNLNIISKSNFTVAANVDLSD